ncbi:MAG: hypothetical protein V6Z81_03640 [Parvularculales bacterium]
MRADEMTAALPGSRLGEIIGLLESAVALNRAMGRYAGEDARRFTGVKSS